jgi:OFA family oxalate/formate antiporter-like MFS transporter
MVRSKEFIPLYLTLTLGISCGMMIITKISGVMQSEFAFTPQRAALIVSLVSLFNTFGRFAIGWVSDKIGRFQAIMLVQATFTVSLVIMGLVPNVSVFLFLLVFLSMSYGGVSSIVAPTTGFVFGQKNIVSNYSLMFSVFAIGSIIGPSLYSILPNINIVFLTASGLSFIGLLFAFYLSKKVRVS